MSYYQKKRETLVFDQVACIEGGPKNFKEAQLFACDILKIANEFYPMAARNVKDKWKISTHSKQQWLLSVLPKTVNPYELDKETAESLLSKVMWSRNEWIFVYYTGHGCKNSGSWSLGSGEYITWTDISSFIQVRKGNVTLFLDCCYSGNWAKNLEQLKGRVRNVVILAASHPGETSLGFWKNKKYGSGSNGMLRWKKLINVMSAVASGQKIDQNTYKAFKNCLIWGCVGFIDDKGQYTFTKFQSVHNN
eukprot:54915_1